MTKDEAIEILQEEHCWCQEPCYVIRAIEIAIDALRPAPAVPPLTQADLDKMHFERVWIDYGPDEDGELCGEEGIVLYGKLYSIDTLEGAGFEELLFDSVEGETLDRPSGAYTVYRQRPNAEPADTPREEEASS